MGSNPHVRLYVYTMREIFIDEYAYDEYAYDDGYDDLLENENSPNDDGCDDSELDDDTETDNESEEVSEDISDVIPEPEVKPKRGRKPKDRIYFGEVQEAAVKRYIIISNTLKKNGIIECTPEELAKFNSENCINNHLTNSDLVGLLDERNKIYEDNLAPALKKMVEAIIRGQELYIPNEEFIDTYRDTLSHLLSKADKFEIDKGKRAYSYYSNVCKNYLIAKKQKATKMMIRNPSYDALELDFANDINYSTSNDDKGKKVAEEEVRMLTARIKEMISAPEENGLKENEVKVGEALINLFENWDYVLSMGEKNSAKLNKSVVLLFLREQTGLDTKGIRDNLKKFKREFLIIKNFIVS